MISACDHNADGEMDYKEFINCLARDKFVGAQPQTQTFKIKRQTGDPLADPLAKLRDGVTPEELVRAHSTVRDRLLDRYDTILKAFKFMDKDGSGYITRSEFEDAMRKLNITGISKAVRTRCAHAAHTLRTRCAHAAHTLRSRYAHAAS